MISSPRRYSLWMRTLAGATGILIAALFVAFYPSTAKADTILNADVTTDTTWTLAGSPYTMTTSIDVKAGATLTIEPGVEVRVGEADQLIVHGRLIADGTSAAPILFTGTSAEAGWWYGIAFNGTANTPNTGSILDHVTVEYGGRGGYGNVDLTYAEVTITNSTFRNGATSGIRGQTEGVAHVSDSTFTGNGAYALEFRDGDVDPILANLTISGNGFDSIYFGNGTITTDRTWRALGVPYIFDNITVAAGATLTVEPGVEARFVEATELHISGRLLADGTPEAPILFTGDFSDASEIEPGWWYGVSFNGTANTPNTGSILDHVTVEYSGRGGYGNVTLTYAEVTITNSTFRNGAASGIRGQTEGVAHISDSTFTGNGAYAIEFGDGDVDPMLANLTINNNTFDSIYFGNGTITTDRTWRALGVPYIFANTTVAAGATLTVEPGVEARFLEANELRINGRIVADGTSEAPILFTGAFSDTMAAAVSGWWYGVSLNGTVNTPATGEFDYVTIEYSGRGEYGNLTLTYATANINHSTFRNSSANGILGQTKGVAHIANSTFTGNGGFPIEFLDGSVKPILSNLTITGNGEDLIAFGTGTISGEYVWRALGVPYLFANLTVDPGATLTVEPGVEARFLEATEFRVRGRLVAIGLEDRPIRFTADAPAPGFWYGVSINGTVNTPATGEFDYVTIEYSGRGEYANLNVLYGQVVFKNGKLINSSAHGLKVSGNSLVTVEASEIVNNADYGVLNIGSDDTMVLAANNWWGSPTGPTSDSECNEGGTGSLISAGVAFKPFLTSGNEKPGPISPTEGYILSLTPQRWFAPADGRTEIRVVITLQSGDGFPIPGQRVHMSSSLGTVESGSLTDAQGQALAFVRSSTPGDAELTATFDRNACDVARTAMAKVTFTPPNPEAQLLESEAPYFSSGIMIDPEPIIRGVPTRLSARLTNTNPFTISVDATFGFVQSGIGLVFGPAGEVIDHLIPPNSESEISVIWTPVVDGHYCIELVYTAERADVSAAEVSAPLQGGRSQRNLNVYPGPMGSPNEKDSLNKADKAIKFVNKMPGGGTLVHKGIISRWWGWMKKTASDISKNLGGDPPRQDYRSVPTPSNFLLNLPELQPGNGISAARAAAINRVTAAFEAMNAYGLAATISLDRYGGAAAAADLEWSSLQAASLIYFKQEMGKALLEAADSLDALIQVAIDEGDTSIMVTVEEILAYQERLRTEGFTEQEIAEAKEAGLTDADIEAARQEILASDPEEDAGDLIVKLGELADALRNLGTTLLTPPNFSISVGGGAGLVAAGTNAEPDKLARVFSVVDTILVGNPLDTTATVELEARRVDLPPDWLVTISPISVTLDAGQQTTVTVTIIPGTAAVQGTTKRVAIEGYANNQLLGGVVMDVIVPRYRQFDGDLDTFLPVIQKQTEE